MFRYQVYDIMSVCRQTHTLRPDFFLNKIAADLLNSSKISLVHAI